MPQKWRYESNDLADFEVLDATDTLAGAPGDDPLDRGIVAPQRWSAVLRPGVAVAYRNAGLSHDQLLAAEEPDIISDTTESGRDDAGWDENATEDEILRLNRDADADPRVGRLTSADSALHIANADYVARDAGIDGGGASAEEAAIHLVIDES